jgi:isocitrate dehydrogenase
MNVSENPIPSSSPRATASVPRSPAPPCASSTPPAPASTGTPSCSARWRTSAASRPACPTTPGACCGGTGCCSRARSPRPRAAATRASTSPSARASGLFANVRETKSYGPYVPTRHEDMNLVIVRENEEDLYAGIEHRQTREVTQSLKLITRPGTERIVRFAFAYARAYGRRKVTCMTKDNIMKATDGLFHKTFDAVAAEYPDIEAEHLIIDIGAARLADTPERFDVIVTLNLYGDVLSDIASQIAGSVGLGGSANVGDRVAMFEAVHGSAPDIAGRPRQPLGHAARGGADAGARRPGRRRGAHRQRLAAHAGGRRPHGRPLPRRQQHRARRHAGLRGRRHRTPRARTPGTCRPCTTARSTCTSSCPSRPPSARTCAASTSSSTGAGRTAQTARGPQTARGAQMARGVTPRCSGRPSPRRRRRGWHLKMVTNRGVKVWPEGFAETFCTDHWRCRFHPSDGAVTDFDAVLRLLGRRPRRGLRGHQDRAPVRLRRAAGVLVGARRMSLGAGAAGPRPEPLQFASFARELPSRRPGPKAPTPSHCSSRALLANCRVGGGRWPQGRVVQFASGARERRASSPAVPRSVEALPTDGGCARASRAATLGPQEVRPWWSRCAAWRSATATFRRSPGSTWRWRRVRWSGSWGRTARARRRRSA